ncbi:TIGR02300 family protein [Roseivivax sp. CAU 1761]
MPKEEWGVKRLCPTTGKRFYDLNRNPVVSPYTGEVVEVETGKRSMIAADAADGAPRKASKAREKDHDESVIEDDDVDVELDDDDVLDDDDEDNDNVSLDDIADVSEDDED